MKCAPRSSFVGELIGTALHTHRLDLRTGGEGILQHAAVFQVFEFGTHESGAFARFHVLKIYDLEGLAVQFDAHADLDVCCSCHRNIFIYDFRGGKVTKICVNRATSAYFSESESFRPADRPSPVHR